MKREDALDLTVIAAGLTVVVAYLMWLGSVDHRGRAHRQEVTA